MSGVYVMAGRSVLRLERQPGTVIRVCSGAVWLTQEGDMRDYYLTAGESLTVKCDGTVLATAIGRSEVSVSARVPRGSRAQRLVKLLASLAFADAS